LERTSHPHHLAAAILALGLSAAFAPQADAVPAGATQVQGKDCSRDSTGLIPLNDLGVATYQGVQGGLYGGGSNQSPYGHEFDGLRIARGIVPLDTTGAVNGAAGRIVMVSLGGNNANLHFAVFMTRLAADTTRNPKLTAVNGAVNGYDLRDAADPQSGYWDSVAASLRAAGSSPAQAQVAWMSFYVEASLGSFATSTDSTARLLTRAIRNARARLPNLKQLFLTPGIYTGYDTRPALTEPNSYWTGFAYRQVILSQVAGDSLNFDPARGAVVAPWIGWGPYLWADGRVPRSDGLAWPCSAFTGNGYVPSQAGRSQFADGLSAFFNGGDPAAAPWYRPQSALDVPGGPPTLATLAALVVGPVPAWSATHLRVTSAGGAWSLRVMDLQGRTRRVFAGTGPADVAWDLRDRDGVRVPSGVYWAQLRTPAGSTSKPVVVR
jgi:hypothetical protein